MVSMHAIFSETTSSAATIETWCSLKTTKHESWIYIHMHENVFLIIITRYTHARGVVIYSSQSEFAITSIVGSHHSQSVQRSLKTSAISYLYQHDPDDSLGCCDILKDLVPAHGPSEKKPTGSELSDQKGRACNSTFVYFSARQTLILYCSPDVWLRLYISCGRIVLDCASLNRWPCTS